MGRKSSTVATDVTLGAGVQVMVRQVAKAMDGLDIMVNAPDLFLGKAAEATTDVEWNKVMQVNLAGTFHGCRAAGKERGTAHHTAQPDPGGPARPHARTAAGGPAGQQDH